MEDLFWSLFFHTLQYVLNKPCTWCVFAAGSYVALTLLGRPPGQSQRPLDPPPQPQYTPPTPTAPGPPHTPTSRISGPQAVDVSTFTVYQATMAALLSITHINLTEISYTIYLEFLDLVESRKVLCHPNILKYISRNKFM